MAGSFALCPIITLNPGVLSNEKRPEGRFICYFLSRVINLLSINGYLE